MGDAPIADQFVEASVLGLLGIGKRAEAGQIQSPVGVRPPIVGGAVLHLDDNHSGISDIEDHVWFAEGARVFTESGRYFEQGMLYRAASRIRSDRHTPEKNANEVGSPEAERCSR